MISKGTGGFTKVSNDETGQTQKKRHLEHDDFISHTTLLQYEKTLAYSPSDSVIISTHKVQVVTFYSLP